MKLAQRGLALNKLLDLSDMPGVLHAYWHSDFDTEESNGFWSDEKKGFFKWVRNAGKKFDY